MASYTVPMPPDAITCLTWNRPILFGNAWFSGPGCAVYVIWGLSAGPAAADDRLETE